MDKHKVSTGKRIFDVVFSGIILLVASPIMLLTALAIAMESRGPVIYVSRRVGWGYDIFNFYKFRSMYRDADTKLNDLENKNAYANDQTKKEDRLKEFLICPDCELPDSPCSPLLYIHGYQICENKYLEYKRQIRKEYTFINLRRQDGQTDMEFELQVLEQVLPQQELL